MNCTKIIQRDNSAWTDKAVAEAPRVVENFDGVDAEGTLTNYKKVVDIDLTASLKEHHKIVHYGLSSADFEDVKNKLKCQKDFLQFSYLYDRINQNSIPLGDLIISANHTPERYYAEIQNRVNTLTTIAKQKNLKPLFMTLTLPSEYHKHKILQRQGIPDKLVPNPKYNGISAKESVKVLTKMFAKLRHDRSLKELSKEQRIYFRVNEPHKDGTPHTHILMFIPQERIERVKKAFKRLFDDRANDIQDDIEDATAYVMKYINKTLPLSKQQNLSEKEQYLNAWYSKHRIVRFNSSRTLAPLSIYRILHHKFSLYALTKLLDEDHFIIYLNVDTKQVMEILNEWGEEIYMRSSNFDVVTTTSRSNFRAGYLQNNSQTSESAIGMPR